MVHGNDDREDAVSSHCMKLENSTLSNMLPNQIYSKIDSGDMFLDIYVSIAAPVSTPYPVSINSYKDLFEK